jgi:malonate transporter and related proteins
MVFGIGERVTVGVHRLGDGVVARPGLDGLRVRPSTAGSATVVALVYAALAWWRWRLPAAELTAGGLAISYVNAGNLGVPISVYVLGNASYVAPVLLLQVLVMAPVGLALLAGSSTGSTAPSWRQFHIQPLRTRS